MRQTFLDWWVTLRWNWGYVSIAVVVIHLHASSMTDGLRDRNRRYDRGEISVRTQCNKARMREMFRVTGTGFSHLSCFFLLIIATFLYCKVDLSRGLFNDFEICVGLCG